MNHGGDQWGRNPILVEHLQKSDRPFLAAVIYRYEGDVGLEHGDMGRVLRIENADLIGHGGISLFRPLAGNAEDRAVADAVAELDLVHGDGDELAVRELRRRGDPRGLIDP